MWWALACGTGPGFVAVEAPLVVVADPIPARFTADPELLWTDPLRAPPLGAVQRAACADEPGVRRQLADRVDHHPDDVASMEVLSGACEDPQWCRFLERHAVAEPPVASSPWWTALAQCSDDRSQAQLRGAGAEIWLRALQYRPTAYGFYDEGIGAATAEAIARGDVEGAVTGLRILGFADEPAAERDLLALHRVVPPAWKDRVALCLWGAHSREGRSAFRAACADSDDMRCKWTRRDPLDAARVASAPHGLYDAMPDHERAVTQALHACVASAEPSARRACAAELLRHGEIPLISAYDDGFADVRKAVALGTGLAGALREAGVEVPAGTEVRVAIDGVVAAGLGIPVDPLLDSWSASTERLLLRIAAAADAPELRFLVVLASDYPTDRVPLALLYAWDGRSRYRGTVDPDADIDLHAVVRFANAVLAHTAHPERVGLDVDATTVLVAPPEVLGALVEAELVLLADLAPPPDPTEEPPADPLGSFLEELEAPQDDP